VLVVLLADDQLSAHARTGKDGGITWGDYAVKLRQLCDASPNHRLPPVGLSKFAWPVDTRLKYARVVHLDIEGESGRTRIKQECTPRPVPIPQWYPPKWGLTARGDLRREPREPPLRSMLMNPVS
jgi:hypothetical protein